MDIEGKYKMGSFGVWQDGH